MAGLYLAMSPWIVGFTDLSTLAGNDLISGVAVTLLALGLASAYGRTHGIAWVTPLIGVWTIIAPWVVSGDVSTTATVWSNVVIGAVIVILGLGTMAPGLSRRR
jgi:MFS superfamily sulfate permease-like transporter